MRCTIDISDDDPRTPDDEQNADERVIKINDHEANRGRSVVDGGLNVLFEIFTHKRRRYILYYVHDLGEPVTIEEIAEHVLTQEAETDVAGFSEKELQACILDIYHNHLPKLEEANVVDYDPQSQTVRAWEYAETIQPLLEIAKQLEDTINT